MTDEPTDPGSTTILGMRALKHAAPGWYWLQRNFTLAPVLTIIALVAGGGWFLISQRIQILMLQTESKNQKSEIVHITQIVPDASMLATLRTKVDDHEGRIARIEKDWDYARNCPPYCPDAPAKPVRPTRK